MATAVVKGQCRRSSDADVQFYGFEINILFNLSIIYQYINVSLFNLSIIYQYFSCSK